MENISLIDSLINLKQVSEIEDLYNCYLDLQHLIEKQRCNKRLSDIEQYLGRPDPLTDKINDLESDLKYSLKQYANKILRGHIIKRYKNDRGENHLEYSKINNVFDILAITRIGISIAFNKDYIFKSTSIDENTYAFTCGNDYTMYIKWDGTLLDLYFNDEVAIIDNYDFDKNFKNKTI